jgi:hypothetical protein
MAFRDGYGFRCRDAPEEAHSPIKILKLQGSVNWAQQSETDVIAEIEHKKDFFDGAVDDFLTYRKRAGRWNMGRHLIVPSYMKDLSSNRLLLRLWSQARAALRDSNSKRSISRRGWMPRKVRARIGWVDLSAITRRIRDCVCLEAGTTRTGGTTGTGGTVPRNAAPSASYIPPYDGEDYR